MILAVEYTDLHVAEVGLTYATGHAVGLDLVAARNPNGGDGAWCLPVDGKVSIDCGIKIVIPDGYEGEIRMRSGHGFKQDLTCHNGTIDPDYRGPIKVRVRNESDRVQRIEWGERFAQLILHPVLKVEVIPVTNVVEYAASERGEGGFGSTGKGFLHDRDTHHSSH